MNTNNCELTILMPCLNEAETLEVCIKKARKFLEYNSIDGEILIADNGSTDGSQEIAKRNGARVINVEQKGYGSALIGGCNAAKGQYVIMGDADDSYDFLNLMPFLEKLRAGDELVMGNRFKGGIAKGAMPPLHQYLGNPILSGIGRLFFPSEIRDFHCGLRGYNTESIRNLGLHTAGMEYASEMVVQATLNNLKISEIPTTLSPDGRSRPPHLRTWSDGWHHLKFLMMHSPKWLFLYPGAVLFFLGLIFFIILEIGTLSLNRISFDINTLLYCSSSMITGYSLISFYVFTNLYAVNSGFIPTNKLASFLEKLTLEKGLIIGFLLFIIGVVVTIISVRIWSNNSFGRLNASSIMRVTIPAVTFIIIGVELMFAGFFVDILRIKIKK